jgi:hypothetical protein
MKIFSAGGPVKRSTAKNCLLVNQLATPGLGSLMGRRIIAGALQLSLAVLGFVLVIAWFVQKMYRLISELPPDSGPYSWTGKAGAILFLASWLLAWITSLSLLRESRKHPAENPVAPPLPPSRPLPPKLR